MGLLVAMSSWGFWVSLTADVFIAVGLTLQKRAINDLQAASARFLLAERLSDAAGSERSTVTLPQKGAKLAARPRSALWPPCLCLWPPGYAVC